jgi:hypothetical protein
VLARTSANETFIMGSHVMQYGAVRIAAEHAGSYMGPHGGWMSASGPFEQCSVSVGEITRTLQVQVW